MQKEDIVSINQTEENADAVNEQAEETEGVKAKKKLIERHPLFNMRYIVLAAVSGIVGILLGTYCDLTLAAMTCAVIAIIFLLYCFIFKEKKIGVIVFLIFAMFFYAYSSSIKDRVYSNEPYQGAIQGVVRSERRSKSGESYLVVSTKVYDKNVNVSISVEPSDTVYKQGDIVSGTLELFPLEDKENQYSYDPGLHGLATGIEYRSFAEADSIAILGHESSIMSVFYYLRSTMKDNLNNALGAEDASLLGSMLLGGNETMDEDDAQLFRDTGIAHIFSVSGLHVSIIANALDALLIALKIRRKSRWWIIGLFLALYCAVTAFATSIIRAAIMTTIMYLAGARSTNYDPLCALGFAALVVMIINPFSIFSTGCQLSFMACFGIFSYDYVMQTDGFAFRKTVGTISATVSAQAATLPIMINSYGSVSIIATLANLIIVPIASIALVGALALSLQALTIPYTSYLLVILHPISRLIYLMTELMAAPDFASVAVHAMSVIAVVVYYLLFLTFSKYYSVYWKARLLTCVLIIALLAGIVFGVPMLNENNSEIVFLSVGNGDCTVIRTGNEYFIIDGGSGDYYNTGLMSNDGYRALTDYLFAKGIRQINVIITHDDADHVGAIICMLNNADVKVNNFIYSPVTCQENAMLYGAMMKSESVTEMDSGTVLRCESGAEFRFLYPNFDTSQKTNTSLAFIFEFMGFKALFCGDNQIEDSRYISELDIKCDVMLLPHHGKSNAYSEELIEAADPRIRIISTDDDDITQASGVYATSTSGQISIRINNNGEYTIKEYKK